MPGLAYKDGKIVRVDALAGSAATSAEAPPAAARQNSSTATPDASGAPGGHTASSVADSAAVEAPDNGAPSVAETESAPGSSGAAPGHGVQAAIALAFPVGLR